jgi:hypothetical protein
VLYKLFSLIKNHFSPAYLSFFFFFFSFLSFCKIFLSLHFFFLLCSPLSLHFFFLLCADLYSPLWWLETAWVDSLGADLGVDLLGVGLGLIVDLGLGVVVCANLGVVVEPWV